MIPGLVSTIIPVYNRGEMLREAVASVTAQSWRPIEIIIVDDGSTDDTLRTARLLSSHMPDIVRVKTQANAGPGCARQAGLEIARGEFIQFLDSDDLLLPDKFALQVAGLRQDHEAGISYGKTYTQTHGVRSTKPAQRSGERHRQIFPALLTGRLWETSTPLYRRSALDRIGPWPPKRQMEDWEFDAMAGAAGVKLHYCDAYLAEYRIHDQPRLAHAWMLDSRAMRDRISAYVAILRCAQQAGIGINTPEMRRFARTLFWMGRSAGRLGYIPEAAQLLKLAQEVSRTQPLRAFEIWLYRRIVQLLGWKTITRLDRSS